MNTEANRRARRKYVAAVKADPERYAKFLARRRRRYAKNAPKFIKKQREASTRMMDERALLTGRPKPTGCDICGGNDKRWRLAYDHCHAKGHFRGWLCRRCNLVLGRVNDDPNLLRRMIAYLERTHANISPQFTFAGL